MENSKVNPRIDFVFKKIFGVDENKDLLIDLINSIVGEKDQVSDIHILNPYNEKSFAGDKESILDIKGKDALTGKWYNIEMQISKQGFYNKRALYYWSKLYAGQLRESSDYEVLTKAISINFLNFNTIAEEENYHNVYRMYNTESGKEFIDDIEIHFIELNKYDGHHKIKSLLDKWTCFLKEAGENYELPPELDEVKTIKKAMDVLENIKMSKAEREAYESRMKWLRDEVGAIRTAKKENAVEIAKNLLGLLSDEVIAEKTGLTLEEVKALKNN